MRRPLRAAAAMGVLAAAGLAVSPSEHAASGLGFSDRIYVDHNLAGGEPLVIHPTVDAKGNPAPPGRLIYTAHEGTTHLFRDGVFQAPTGASDFVTNYRNQVNIWTSDDNGATWTKVNFNGTGFFTDPTKNTGFSDPDLTQDEGGNVYNTGIDLANDALFSTPDLGATWPTGTVQCNQGDRPWLAGAQSGVVYLGTNVQGGSHTVFRSKDAGNSCDSSWSVVHGGGIGKLMYDHVRHQLIEAAFANNGFAVGVLPDGGTAFTDHQATPATSIQSHWPSIAIDAAGNYYLVWDTDVRDATTTNGCGLAPNSVGGTGASNTPLANEVMMVSSTDGGSTWSAPTVVAHQSNRRLLWPWVTAGAAGGVAVVWYAYDQVTDPDCGNGFVNIHVAEYTNATNPATRTVSTAQTQDVHQGGICQGGTTCAATGQDRRLGDFFTNALDANGCLLIASGDTTLTDQLTGAQLPTSRPVLFRQTGGPSLTTGADCATPGANVPETRWAAAALIAGAAGALAGERWLSRRRRRRAVIV
jgi:hypothetical protein